MTEYTSSPGGICPDCQRVLRELQDKVAAERFARVVAVGDKVHPDGSVTRRTMQIGDR